MKREKAGKASAQRWDSCWGDSCREGKMKCADSPVRKSPQRDPHPDLPSSISPGEEPLRVIAAVCPLIPTPTLPQDTAQLQKRELISGYDFLHLRSARHFVSITGEERSRKKSGLPGLRPPRMALGHPEQCGT